MRPITTLDDEIVQTSWPGPVTTRLRPVVCRVGPDGRLYARWKGEDGYVGEEQPFGNCRDPVDQWSIKFMLECSAKLPPRWSLVGEWVRPL